MITTHTPIPPLPDGKHFDLTVDYDAIDTGKFREGCRLEGEEIYLGQGRCIYFSADIIVTGTNQRARHWGDPDWGVEFDTVEIEEVFDAVYYWEEGNEDHERDLTPDELQSLTEWLKHRIYPS